MNLSFNSAMMKKTTLASAVVASLGVGALPQSALATTYIFTFSGNDNNVFTMLDPNGAPFNNTASGVQTVDWYGWRTPITGTITYDTVTQQGTMAINGFSFAASGPAVATDVTIQAIGNGSGGAGNLILGNMGFNWGGNNGIPVSIVWDATGLFNAITGGLSVGDTVTGGVVPGSNNSVFGTGQFTYTLPLGSAPLATTTWNTTDIGTVVLGTNPSGTTPLITDTVVNTKCSTTVAPANCTGISSSPMKAGPFNSWNANFDFVSLSVQCVDAACGQGAVSSTTPATGSPPSAPITVTFTRNMQADTVAAAISLVNVTAGNVPIAVTVTPNTGLATVFTITPGTSLGFSTNYQATVSTAALDEGGTNLAASPDNTWSWTTAAQGVAQTCASGVIGPQPLGNNFSMLQPDGKVFGGTNDVVYNFGNGPNNGHDAALLNTTSNGTLGITTNTLASALPHPFFAAIWTAHHIRLFGPGTYTINTDNENENADDVTAECTTAMLVAGTCAASATASKNLTFTVGAGQIGAHMLFDWNGSYNIDVVNVWDLNAAWTDPDLGVKNDLWTGALWAGPSGYTVNPATVWAYVSTDVNGDGNNGMPMIDGPFNSYYANFNLGPTDSCQQSAPVAIAIDSSDKVGGGCSLGSGTVGLTERGDWWLIAGFLAWLGLIRRRWARLQS
jgi:hypothetical protein